jgi:hypothetical protein
VKRRLRKLRAWGWPDGADVGLFTTRPKKRTKRKRRKKPRK